MSTKYTVDYFIEKFSAIPDEKWIVGDYADDRGCCCALGHCGYRFIGGSIFNPVNTGGTDEGAALSRLFDEHHLSVPLVNDQIEARYQQPTPKARILAALADIKAKGVAS